MWEVRMATHRVAEVASEGVVLPRDFVRPPYHRRRHREERIRGGGKR